MRNLIAMHSVFQMYPHSPIVSVKDVRNAIWKSSKMRPYQRLRYFHDKGMHFSRCIKYIDIVEKLEALYKNDHVIELQKQDYTVTIVDYPDEPTETKMSIQEIGKFIEELLKDFEAD